MSHVIRCVLLVLFVSSIAVGFDVPRVEGIKIDGDASDWGDRGFLINVLGAATDRPDPRDLDARARLAWDEQRIVVLLRVTDDVADESESLDTLWQRDSIELFLANKIGGEAWAQLIVSPGVSKDQPAVRIKTSDKRGPAFAEPLKFDVAVKKTASGYDAEIAIPLALLGLKPGDEPALQFYVNDADNDGKSKDVLVFFPQNDTFTNQKSLHPIRLAEKASEPVNVSLAFSQTRLRRMTVTLTARGTVRELSPEHGTFMFWRVSKPVRIPMGGQPLEQWGDLVIGKMRRDLDGLEGALLEAQFTPDGPVVATIEIPRYGAQRLEAFDRLELKPRTYVFHGNTFPTIDFDNIDRAENLVGEYTLSTRFFDGAMNEVKSPTTFGRYGAVVTIQVPNQPARTRYLTLCRLKEEILGDEWEPKIEFPIEEVLKPADPITALEREDLSEHVKWVMLDAGERSEWHAVMLAGLMETGDPAASVWDRNQQWWYDLRQKIGQPLKYKYLEFVPEHAKDQKLPAILFLHGSGERGDDLARLENYGPRGYAKKNAKDFPFIVISPQCPLNEWWNPLAVKDLVDEILAKYPIDPDRLYLTGLSMGGFGTWSTGAKFPEPFAAMVPICGGGDPRDLGKLTDMPIWVVHGGADKTVRPSQSYRMIEALRKKQGRVRFTLYPTAGHDTWTPTYNDPRLYAWLLEQKRGQPVEPRSTEPTTKPTEVR